MSIQTSRQPQTTSTLGRYPATNTQEHRPMKTYTALGIAASLALGAALALPAASQAQDQAAKAAKSPITVENRLPADSTARPLPSRPRQTPAGAEDPNWLTSAYVNSYIDRYGEVDDWTFTVGRYDSYVLIQMNRFSGNLDPHISIYDPWGRLMFSNDDANRFTLNSAIQFRPTWQGTYTIRARSYAWNQTGGYTLWVHRSNLPISY